MPIPTLANEIVIFIQSKDLDQHFTDGGLILNNHKALHKCGLLVPGRVIFSTQTSGCPMNFSYNRVVWCKVSALGLATAGLLLGAGCVSESGRVGGRSPAVPPPSVGVTRNQAWKDAEALAALDPSRLTVIGSGESMKPVYGENTVLVLQRVPFESLAAGMNVAYRNEAGRVVLHRLLTRESSGWRVRGLNNEDEDLERVRPDNLLGIVYAAFANDAVK